MKLERTKDWTWTLGMSAKASEQCGDNGSSHQRCKRRWGMNCALPPMHPEYVLFMCRSEHDQSQGHFPSFVSKWCAAPFLLGNGQSCRKLPCRAPASHYLDWSASFWIQDNCIVALSGIFNWKSLGRINTAVQLSRMSHSGHDSLNTQPLVWPRCNTMRTQRYQFHIGRGANGHWQLKKIKKPIEPWAQLKRSAPGLQNFCV